MSRGLEGGGFSGYRMENSHERGIEARGDYGIEDSERENYWLGEIINPGKLERISHIPAYEGHSKEWIIMDAMLASLVEKGPDMDHQIRQRLRAVVAMFRVLMIPDLTESEQAFMGDLAEATTIDWSAISTKITPDLKDDVKWLYDRFDLKKPSKSFDGFLGGISPKLLRDRR